MSSETRRATFSTGRGPRSCASSSSASRSSRSAARCPGPWPYAERGERTGARRPARDRLARHRVGSRHARDGLGAAVHYAQVRALAAGRAEIDRWQWETRDKAWVGGHFYSVKAPGLAALTLPAYLALDAAGAKPVARDAAANARLADRPRWDPPEQPDLSQYAYSAARAHRVEIRIEHETPIVWALTLVGAVIPAIALLLLVRWVAERIEPGYGTAAAITLGLGTIVMTFAAEYFSHVVAADARVRGVRAPVSRARGPGEDRPGRRRRARWPAWPSASSTRSGSWRAILFAYALARPRRLPRACRRLRRRGRDRGRARAGLQLVGARLAAALRLLARGRRPGTHRTRRAGAQLERLLRDRPAAAGRGARPAGGQPRPPHPDARARDGGGRGGAPAQARPRAPRQR